MRVLIFDTYYPAFLRSHYAEHPGLAERPYGEQLAALMARFFGTSDAYSFHLRELGHEAWEVVPNCAELQRAWLRENGGGQVLRAAPWVRGVRRPVQRAIARRQIEVLAPDVVYCQDLNFFDRRDLARMRADGRLVVGQIASAAPDAETLRAFDLITTSFPHFVERFRALGVDTELLEIGFDERVLGVAPGEQPRHHDAVFVGGLNPRLHPGGVALLERLAREVPIDVWGYGVDASAPDSAIRARWRGEAWGVDMYRVLADARIVVNRHIEAAEGNANNMRLFEATGMGALLLTEAAPNLGELFEPGSEVVAYESFEDLVVKLRHYNENEEERAAIARAGHLRTMRDHTYRQVVAKLAAMLEQRLR